MDLLEILKKPFLKDSKPIKSSIQTTEDNIEYELGGENVKLEIPTAQDYGFGGSRKKQKQKQLDYYQQRDSFIETYRRKASKHKVSNAIDEIVNEMIQQFEDGSIVKLDFKLDKQEKTKETLKEEFDNLLNIISFNDNAYDLCREWYVDGVLNIECLYKEENNKGGIIKALKISPLRFIKFQENDKTYYQYIDSYGYSFNQKKNFYSDEQIVQVESGYWDPTRTFQTSYLYPALKSINDISNVENSIVKYRITRAPEKNIWNIDVGTMNTQKAKQHIQTVSNEVSTNLKYDTETGEVTADTTEGITSDWIFPSRNGKQKTSVETIGGDSDFVSKLDDIQYFRKENYEALKIPIGRLDGDSSLDFDSTDILREEIKWTLFINRLRNKFEKFLKELLKRQVISKGKISEQEWNEISNNVFIVWETKNPIIENAMIESKKRKMESFSELLESGVVGKVVSIEYAVKNILRMTEEEFKEQIEIIKKEKQKYKEFYQSEEDE